MKYTDKQLIRASQMAYCSFNYRVIDSIDEWVNNEKQNNPSFEFNYTISEYFACSEELRRSFYKNIKNYSGLDDNALFELYKNLNEKTYNETLNYVLSYSSDTKTRERLKEELEIIYEIKQGDIGKWRVVSYVDNNKIGTVGKAGGIVNGKWVHNDFSTWGNGLNLENGGLV